MCEVQFANRPVKTEASADEGFVAVQPKRKPRNVESKDDSKKPSYSKIISKK